MKVKAQKDPEKMFTQSSVERDTFPDSFHSMNYFTLIDILELTCGNSLTMSHRKVSYDCFKHHIN